ncbi:DUF4124 domain-containing protein [Azonexus sp.]|jgi:hypothetical protein|uniref:DUF4124 domain-containing protein n=1 Tax=Azonexus sp. TaxID=1872668 RepID=UPI00281E44A6|nr:DUF4124 domain-containing protein [Azonexus sp.]MDR1995423.1 DUF4124 domain-containing protein [Azonexus sp.]
MLRLLLPLALLLLAPAAEAAGEFYCCQDATGRRICGDTLPEQCRGRAYQILDRAGNVIQEVGPPLTPEQKAEQAAADRQRKKQEEAARELRRMDQALLDTYATPQDIDIAQRKAEDDVKLAIRSAQENIEASRAKRQKLEAEAEFYQKKTVPPELQKELRAVDHEIKVQQELIDVKQRELAAIHSKYQADRKRYFELTGRNSAGPAVSRPASSSTTR